MSELFRFLLFVLASVTLLSLTGLVARRFFVVRVGETPFCRRCGYNLTGRASMACSECGAALDAPRAVVRGTRRVSPFGATLTGLLACAAAAVGWTALGERHKVPWHRLEPTAWMLHRLRATGDARAAVELRGRLAQGRLGHASKRALFEICMNRAASAIAAGQPHPAPYEGLLSVMLARGELTKGEHESLTSAMFSATLAARARIGRLDACPLRLQVVDTLCGLPYHVEVKRVYWSHCPGAACLIDPPPSDAPPIQSRGPWTLDLLVAPPDREGECEIILELLLRAKIGAKVLDLSRRVSARVDAVAEIPDGHFELLNDDAHRAALPALNLRLVAFREHGNPTLWEIVGHPRGFSSPGATPCAFEVDLVHGDAARAAGHIWHEHGQWRGEVRLRGVESVPESITVILRPSIRAAKRSISISRFWNEPITIESLPILRP